jgi:hypothetical protein
VLLARILGSVCSIVRPVRGLKKRTIFLSLRGAIFWDKTQCNPLKVNLRFGGKHRLHLQGRKVRQAGSHHAAGSKQRNRLTGISVYIGNRREMEERN